mmetsp:Transcript_18237/g.43084  ORF Transcript_18237/g.43084 Transcript_18237/m.43084 type:complete len:94 (-) Transcript_18237:9-290(-)
MRVIPMLLHVHIINHSVALLLVLTELSPWLTPDPLLTIDLRPDTSVASDAIEVSDADVGEPDRATLMFLLAVANSGQYYERLASAPRELERRW